MKWLVRSACAAVTGVFLSGGAFASQVHHILGVDPGTNLQLRKEGALEGATITADNHGCATFAVDGGGSFVIIGVPPGGNPMYPPAGGPIVFSKNGDGRSNEGLPESPPQDPTPGLSVFPNPTPGPVNLAYTSRVAGAVALAVYDASGRRRGPERILSAVPGANTWSVDLREGERRGLPPGIYWVALRFPAAPVVTKVLLLPQY